MSTIASKEHTDTRGKTRDVRGLLEMRYFETEVEDSKCNVAHSAVFRTCSIPCVLKHKESAICFLLLHGAFS